MHGVVFYELRRPTLTFEHLRYSQDQCTFGITLRYVTNSKQTISNENMTMSAGNLISSGQRRTIRILGEIDTPNELENFVVKSERNNPIYLRDIAKVTFKEPSFNPCMLSYIIQSQSAMDFHRQLDLFINGEIVPLKWKEK